MSGRYYIFIDSGDQVYLLGLHGEYVTCIEDAMWFDDVLQAKIYVDKHGLERITTVRKVILSER